MMIVCLLSVELYLDRTLESQTDSDIAGELILANMLAKENSIITQNWYYSTEIRVLNTNLVFAPLFYFFNDWHTIRILGTIIIHICLLACVFIFCRQTAITVFFPVIGLMMLLPLSDGHYIYFLKFPFYIPHIAITLLVFSLVVGYSEKSNGRIKRFIVLVIGLLFSLIAGLGGPRQVVICFFPLFFSVVVSFGLYKAKTAHYYLEDNWKKYLLISSVCFFAGLIGYIINTKILSNIYHFKLHDISFSSFDAEKMFKAIGGLPQSLGYIPGRVGKKVVFHNVKAAILILLSVFFAIRGIKKGRNQSLPYFFFSVFYLISIVVFILLFSFTDMRYEERFNLPIIIMLAPVIAMGIKYLNDYHQGVRISVLMIWCLIIIVSGYDVLSSFGINKENSGREIIADFLVENEYYEGYATFWNANVLTELSNGRIDMHFWESIKQTEGNIDSTFKWLQATEHDKKYPEGKVFLLFSKSEIRPNLDPQTVASEKLWKLRDERIIFDQMNWVIYGYNSYNDMISDIYDYDFLFQKGEWLINGEDFQGIRILKEEGISYGPYIEFREGRYRVTIQGEGLSNAEFACTSDVGVNQIDIAIISTDDEEVVYEFDINEPMPNGETVIKNISAENVTIYSEQIDYLGR